VIALQDSYDGAFGHAEKLPTGDGPEAIETVVTWLITAPRAHPFWSQYVLGCVRLRDNIPGFPPPRHTFEGSTHELFVVAMNPEYGPYNQKKILDYYVTGDMPYLTPINIAVQFIATDDEMLELSSLATYGITSGILWPETADAPDKIRHSWKTSLVRTLAHIRGEAHAP
jgi:hypothetical protein